MPRSRDNIGDDFNVSYGVASAAITAGNSTISTTEAAYHGIVLVAGSTATALATIYDSVAAGGNILDIVLLASNVGTSRDRQFPTMAKLGIFVTITGTGASGSIFYGPKG
jgi:hypothetical protein